MVNKKTEKERKTIPLTIELQRTKEDLEDLELYTKEFAAFLPLAVATVNPLGFIIDVNMAFEKLTDYRPIEIVGELLEGIFLEKKGIRSLLDEVRKREVSKLQETVLLSKRGEKIPVNLLVSIRKDAEGTFIGYFVGIADISELKKLQESLEGTIRERTKDLQKTVEELRNSRTALMNLLEDAEGARRGAVEERDKTLAVITNFTDGLLLFDRADNLSLINPEARILFGIRPEEVEKLQGKPLSELKRIPKLRPLIELLGKEIKRVFRKELELRENLFLEVSTASVIGEKERVGTLVILHDISKEKVIERMKTEFVSLAAHQLRTPLSAIKWTLRMLLDGDLGEVTTEQRKFIEGTYQSNERMIILINDLLNVTRIEEGRFLYNVRRYDIINIAKGLIPRLKEMAQRKELKFEFKVPGRKIPKLNLDSEKIALAIGNLVENAIHYTKHGGRVTVSMKYNERRKEVRFIVRDTGIGIPADQRERVFSKFFRAANAIKTETQGSGLGLFITKNIIEAHGGKVWFESEENRGTTFYFTLPLKPERFEEFVESF